MTALAAGGFAWPERAERLLTPVGGVLVPAVAFALAGAADFGVQSHYAEVAPAIVWIAAVVSSARWVWACVAVSITGYTIDVALRGHSLAWMLSGAGQNATANQIVDLVANAAVVLLLVAVLRRFVNRIPASLEAVRSGGPALTPQLALSASGRHLHCFPVQGLAM